ncbi:MAG: hypothetical protein WA294_08195 [Acidobacteriaceae bacterium]
MEITSPPDLLHQFIRDCAVLSARIDQVSSQDGHRLVLATLIMGRDGYQSLMKRRGELPKAVANAPLVQAFLDRLLARLQFLGTST